MQRSSTQQIFIEAPVERAVFLVERALRIRLGTVADQVAADGPRLRMRRLAPVHAVAMAARWTGRLLG